jgi:hypothetical protein
MFISKIFMKYYSNSIVSKNTTVLSTLMCLSITKNCGINISLSLKTCCFWSIRKTTLDLSILQFCNTSVLDILFFTKLGLNYLLHDLHMFPFIPWCSDDAGRCGMIYLCFSSSLVCGVLTLHNLMCYELWNFCWAWRHIWLKYCTGCNNFLKIL